MFTYEVTNQKAKGDKKLNIHVTIKPSKIFLHHLRAQQRTKTAEMKEVIRVNIAKQF